MEPKFNLIIDSTCDLPRSVWDKPGITMLHFSYADGGAVYVDDLFASRTPKEFYDWMREGAQPKTSQPSQAEFEDAFRDAIQSGVPTVYLAFGHALSGCYEGAVVALERMHEEFSESFELYVVDTMLPCTPQGLLVADAIRLRESGMSAKELVEWAQEARYFVNVMFMVDSLESLHRGGRVPAGVAVAGDMLDVKPMLSIDLEGALTLVGAARGRKKGVKKLLDFFDKNHSTEGDMQLVSIGNADCHADAKKLLGGVTAANGNAIVIEHSIGPTIGSHVGPNMLSLAFWGPDRRENLSIADRIANRVKSS